MAETMTYRGALTVTSCWCGISHAVPETLHAYQNKEFERGHEFAIYCPLGHKYVPGGESEAAKLRKELERKNQLIARERAAADQTAARLRDQVSTAENGRRAEKAAKTRIKNRIAKGVCPCCHRSFGIGALQKHIETKHPGYATAE